MSLEERPGPLGHHDDAGGQGRQFRQHPPLVVVRLAEDGVEGRDDRHPQVAQQAEDVAAGRPAVDAVLVLEADDVGVGEVQEVGRPAVALQVLLVDLEPDLRRVVVPLGAVVDRDDEALGVREPAGHRGVHVVGEGGDPALPGQVVADEGDLADLGRAHDGGLRVVRPAASRDGLGEGSRRLHAPRPTIWATGVTGGGCPGPETPDRAPSRTGRAAVHRPAVITRSASMPPPTGLATGRGSARRGSQG